MISSTIFAATLFPLGLYGVSQPQHLAGIRHAGFSVVVPAVAPSERAAFGRAASMEDLKLLAPPPESHPAFPYFFPLLPSLISFPLAAFYLADEPDVTGM